MNKKTQNNIINNFNLGIRFCYKLMQIKVLMNIAILIKVGFDQ